MATMKEMVQAHNEAAQQLGEKSVKRFRSKDEAEERTQDILKRLKARKPGRKAGPIDWPCTGVEHKVRGGTIGEMFINMLKKGTTMAGLVEGLEGHDAEIGSGQEATAGRVRSILRVLHTYNGYGIRQKGNTLKLVSK